MLALPAYPVLVTGQSGLRCPLALSSRVLGSSGGVVANGRTDDATMRDGGGGENVNVGRLRAERALTHPATSLTTQTRDKTATLDPDCMQHCRFSANPAIAIRLRALVQAVVQY
jgi:hypothetical protein